MLRRWLLVAVGLIAAGCASDAGQAASDRGVETSLGELVASMDMDERMGEIEAADPSIDITMREIEGADPDALQQIANVESFWTEVGAEIGLTYEPLDSSRLFPRSALERSGPIWCSASGESIELTAELTSFNALVANCPEEGITVLWDDLDLKPFLDRNFPDAGFAQLIAHEWGHVVQNQLEPVDRTTLLAEQQADCYAGAYIRWAERVGSEPFTTPRARDLATLSTLESRDQIGTSPASPTAHGNGFDRIRAMQEGYDSGVAFCAGFDQSAPPITQMAFASDDDAAGMGDLPFDQATALLVPALESHFQSLADEPIAAFVVPPNPSVVAAQHAAIGEGAIVTLVGQSHAAAVQQATGADSAGVEAALQRTCLVGTFLNRALAGDIEVDAANGPQTLTLSPGDIDEAITSFTSFPDIVSNPGLIFEVIAALRIGTIEGLDGCELDG